LPPIGRYVHHHVLVRSEGREQLRARLKLLLDSNIVVAAEPYTGVMEANLDLAATLVRLANELGHVLCVAPATRDDVLQNPDHRRRQQRLAELMKFSQLEEVPLTASFVARAGDSEHGSNDHRDLRILATLDAGAASYLVTEDQRLWRRARRKGLNDLVISLPEAVELLMGFTTPATSTPPRVERCATYVLDPEQEIFESLRGDYPCFDEWFAKVRRDSDNRTCLVVKEVHEYAAIALLKTGAGELLLKAIFTDAAERRTVSLYVEILPKHEALVSMLADFGFVDTGYRTSRGELVMLKSREPDHAGAATLTDLKFHIRFGPPGLRPRQSAFVVPIKPIWHDQLFPERVKISTTDQLPLFDIAASPITHPWGNALRKAYLCNSPTNQIADGDVLLFYQSEDAHSVTAVGIVEATLRSDDAEQIVQFVGHRTVYTLDEISVMCRSVRGVLAIRFRQDRFIDPELSPADLKLGGIIKSWRRALPECRTGACNG
jgi:predicted nucleic acid-binding protein